MFMRESEFVDFQWTRGPFFCSYRQTFAPEPVQNYRAPGFGLAPRRQNPAFSADRPVVNCSVVDTTLRIGSV